MPKTVITISRQIGSGGAEVGQIVAARMGLRYVDREILRQAADVLGLEETELSEREERIQTFWEKLGYGLSYGAPDWTFVPPPLLPIPDEEVRHVENDIIRSVAARENCVIVGRGGFHILEKHPCLVSVLLHAPVEFRIRRVMEIYNVGSYEKGKPMVEASDRDRRAFIFSISGADWMCARNHQLCIDSSSLPLEDVADLIVTMANKRERE